MNWWLLRRRVHYAWLIGWLCLGFIVGIFISSFVQIENILLILIPILLLMISFVKRYLVLVGFVVVAGLSIGIYRGSMLESELNKIDNFIGQSIEISGRVIDDVDVMSDTKFALRLDNIEIDDVKLSGQIYITFNQPNVRKHDYLVLTGRLRQGFGRFGGVIYDAVTLRHIKVSSISRDFRDSFSGNVRSVIKDPEASLGVGFLLGEKKALPNNLVEMLKLAGLTHIVVASGYNLTVLVRIARRLFVKYSKYLSLVSALLMVFGFISITGLSPSMIRAGIVSVLSLLAWYYGRKFHPVILLLFVATLTLMYDPSYLMLDVSWQLSFMAFAGVMILAPLLVRYFFGSSKVGFLKQLIIETVSAQLATLPILIVIFGQISNVALVANILVLPLVPLAMLLVFMAGLFSYLIPVFGLLFGQVATLLLGYMLNVIKMFAELPWAVTEISFTWLIGGACYLVMFLVVIYLQNKTNFNLREVNIVE